MRGDKTPTVLRPGLWRPRHPGEVPVASSEGVASVTLGRYSPLRSTQSARQEHVETVVKDRSTAEPIIPPFSQEYTA